MENSSHNFKAGDRVVVNKYCVDPAYKGIKGTVTDNPHHGRIGFMYKGQQCWKTGIYHTVSLDNGESKKCENLVLDPIYDGDQPSTWDECAWKPNMIKV